MFWSSVSNGIEVLLYWETYASVVGYLLLFILPTALLRYLSRKKEHLGAAVNSVAPFILFMFQVTATVVFVITMSPLIFGTSDVAAWRLPLQLMSYDAGLLAKHIAMCLAVVVALSFVPLLGSLQSLHVLAVGAVTLVFVLGLYEPTHTGIATGAIQVFPDVWTIIGIFLVSALISSGVDIILRPLVVVAVTFLNGGESTVKVAAMATGAVAGFIPVFIYGAWLAQHVRMVVG